MNREAILRDGLMLSGRRFWAALLGLAFAYLSAKILGPKGLGWLAILRVLPSFALILNFGWVEASCREILHLHGGGQETVARELRDVAYSAEAGVSLVWSLAILGYSLSWSDWTARVGLWIAAVALLATLLRRLLLNDIAIQKDFRLPAKVGVLTATLNLAGGIGAAWFWGPVGLFAALTLVQILEVAIYWRVLKFSFKPSWNKRVLARLTWIGLPLAALTFFGSATGVNLWIERGIIGSQGGLEVLGVFVFSISIVNWLDILVGELVVSFQAHFWETLGKYPTAAEIFALVRKPSLVLAFMAAILAVLVLAVIPPLVYVFLGKYRSMLDVMGIFIAGGLVVTIYKIPSILLRSAFANKQTYFMIARMICTLLYGGMLWLLVAKAGLGLAGAAWSVLFLQVSAAIFMLAKAYPYYVESFRGACRFLGEQLLPMFLVGGVYWMCQWVVRDSGHFRSAHELSRIIMVSVPMAVISLAILISLMELKTSVLRQLYGLVKSGPADRGISNKPGLVGKNW